MPPVPGRSLLNRIIDRVWESGQDAATQEARELVSITLRFLRLRDLNAACCAALGMHFDVWRARSADRKDFLYAQLRDVASSRALNSIGEYRPSDPIIERMDPGADRLQVPDEPTGDQQPGDGTQEPHDQNPPPDQRGAARPS
jgi:hypothetical protein